MSHHVKRAALYIRVSTDEQARHGLSLGEQQADLERYAKAHNYAVVGIYADEGATARKTLSRRHELQRMLDDVRSNLIDIIIFKCLDRWIRSVPDYYKVQEVLDAYSVGWECSQEEYNTTTTNGRLMLNLKLSIAQNESDQTGDRIRYINKGKLARHEILTGKHSIGYKVKDKHLVIDEEKAEAVRFLFSQIVQGVATHSLASLLLQHFGIAVTSRTIWRMLRREIYIGVRGDDEHYCPPIIDKDTFYQVQSILSRNMRPVRSGRIYIFSGLIACPVCGNTLYGHRGNRNAKGEYQWYDYRCGNRWSSGLPMESPDACQYKSAMSEGRVERFLVENVQRLIQEHIYQIVSKAEAAVDYTSQINAAKVRLARLKELYINGLIELDVYRSDYNKLQSELADLVQKSLKPKDTIPPVMDRIVSMDNFAELYQSLNKTRRQELWRSLIKRIEFEYKPLVFGAPLDFTITFL